MTENLRALVVEDSEDDALLLVRQLAQQGYKLQWERVQTASDLRKALSGRDWDVVLSDFKMPQFNAHAALEICQDFDPDLPFIVISGTVGEDVAVETMRAGAHDYFMKGRLRRLGQAIEREVRDADIRRENRASITRIHHLNRVLCAIRNIGKLIVTEKDRRRLIERAADMLVETRGYISALCACIDDKHAPTLVAYSRDGDDGDFSPQRVILDTGLTACMKEALRSAGPVVINCDTSDCGECPLQPTHANRLRLAKSIMHESSVLGVLSIVLPDGITPDAEELDLLSEMAGDIGFALFGIQQSEILEAQSALLTAAVDAMPDTFFLFDPASGKALRWNEEFRRNSGYSDDEIAALPAPMSYYGPEDLERAAAAMESLSREKKAKVTLDLLTKQGTRVPTEYIATTIQRAGGEALILSIGRDITQRKRAEELLQTSEARLKLAQRVAHIGHWEIDSYDGTPVWSDEVYRIFGIDTNDQVPSFTDHNTIVHPEEWPLLDAAVRAGLDNGKSFDLSFRILRPGQEIGWMHAIGTAMPDDKGNIVKLFGTTQDITKVKKVEEELREAKQILEGIINSITVRVFWKDKNLVYLGCNDVFARDAGFTSPQDVIGKDDFQMVWRDQADLYRSDDRQVIESSCSKLLIEEPQITPTGDTLTLLTSKIPLRSTSGETVGVLGTYLDISEIKRMQAQLAQADRLSSMGMLAAGVAHEINNPLSYILYNLESLSEDMPDLLNSMRNYQARVSDKFGSDVVEEIVGDAALGMNSLMLDDIQVRIRDALGGTQRIRDIAKGLGTFSRVERDQLLPVNLMHAVEGALNMCYNEIKYRARVVKDFGQVPMIMASEGRLSQVFLNLFVNAAHAIDEGDVEGNEIRVRTWTEGDTVCVEVRDTGKGVSPQHIDKLFEPFFTTKGVGVGSGLGLPISKGIVEGYGGTITVSSEQGKGTSFVIRLPVQVEEAASSPNQEAAEDDKWERGRILVVDDEAVIRGVIARILQKHEIVEVATGDEAKRLLEGDQAFDLILCDIMMPKVSGMDLHAWLLEEHPQLARQIIFITGGAFTPRAREYLKKIDNLRLEKPFDAANFKRIVNDRIIVARQDSRKA